MKGTYLLCYFLVNNFRKEKGFISKYDCYNKEGVVWFTGL